MQSIEKICPVCGAKDMLVGPMAVGSDETGVIAEERVFCTHCDYVEEE